MKLEELFAVVSDEQNVILLGTFDEVSGFKSSLEAVLSEQVLEMPVDCVEAAFDGDLKVWVKTV